MRIRTLMAFCTEELWIHRELKGKGVKLERSGMEMEIRFPPLENHAASQRSDFSGSTGTREDPHLFVKAERLFVVVHSEEADILSVDEGPMSAVSNHQERCVEIATEAMTDFLDRLRVGGQYWLGSVGEKPRREGIVDSFDPLTGRRFNIGFGGNIILQHRPQSAMLTSTSLEAIQQDLVRNATIPTAESFLTDSLHLREAEHVMDIQRAVLMAAIACEIKVQQILRERVPLERRGLLLVILRNHREIETAKIMLFHTVMKAALGCSLRDANQSLYESIELLFRMRNKIVHEGTSYPKQAMRQVIWDAKEVFPWLNAISSDTGAQKAPSQPLCDRFPHINLPRAAGRWSSSTCR